MAASGNNTRNPEGGKPHADHGDKAVARESSRDRQTADRADAGNMPGLVAPSRLNLGDHGAADDAPSAGGELNFDDDELAYSRGKTTRMGGTNRATGADSAPLGPPAEIQSDNNQPSDRPGSRGADGSGQRGD